MKITRAEVEKVARLSRLTFSDQELEALTQDMDAILNHVEQLNELDTDDIVPMAHAVPFENAFRDDVVTASIGSELALQNAPNSADGCFGVPKVIE
ncbi:MAG: aspartyl/glutamyl-tRNA(Asn/Gln) amidotransferase subunit C [Desulfobacteraceae bacterium 4572_35.1]|nr:MAG: aspartyl/glutamyl-tRNA(Asn/Gln) amidotransferase subunit C [Desulfobacteraceae bacterium 4572_35.1]